MKRELIPGLRITYDEQAKLVHLAERLDAETVQGFCMSSWECCLHHHAGVATESTRASTALYALFVPPAESRAFHTTDQRWAAQAIRAFLGGETKDPWGLGVYIDWVGEAA
jgi:hypothetical protein